MREDVLRDMQRDGVVLLPLLIKRWIRFAFVRHVPILALSTRQRTGKVDLLGLEPVLHTLNTGVDDNRVGLHMHRVSN